MNKLKIAIFGLVAMFVLTGCSVKNKTDIVKINDTVITQKQFDKAYETAASNAMFEQMGIDLKSDEDNIFSLMMRERIISELMVKALLNEEMDKRKITVSKAEMEDGEKEIVEKFGNKEQFMEVLKLHGVAYDNFKKDLKDEIKMKKYVDAIALVSVGEGEAKKYYNANLDKFKYPKRVRASHILIAANPDQIKTAIKEKDANISDEDLAKKVEEQMNENYKTAQKLQQQVQKAPTTFAKVAQENSQDIASAIRGGDLGFFAKEEMVEPFANKAFAMAPNTISEVIQTPYGYHIIMVTDRSEAGVLPFEESKKDIINFLESQDKVEILKNKIEALRKEAKIEFYNKDYDPENIQKKIKEETTLTPAMKKALNQDMRINK